jgi:hypothetical protein
LHHLALFIQIGWTVEPNDRLMVFGSAVTTMMQQERLSAWLMPISRNSHGVKLFGADL